MTWSAVIFLCSGSEVKVSSCLSERRRFLSGPSWRHCFSTQGNSRREGPEEQKGNHLLVLLYSISFDC